MASLLQHLLSPLDPGVPDRGQALQDGIADDIALGCECANPALQFEGWDALVALAARGPGSAPAC